MTDKQVKVAKPAKPNSTPIKPTPIKTTPVKPAKAHAEGGICVRCGNNPVATRFICHTCDSTLQDMHWRIEYTLFGKTFYAADPATEEPSLAWLETNGFRVRKTPRSGYQPKLPRRKPSEAMIA